MDRFRRHQGGAVPEGQYTPHKEPYHSGIKYSQAGAATGGEAAAMERGEGRVVDDGWKRCPANTAPIEPGYHVAPLDPCWGRVFCNRTSQEPGIQARGRLRTRRLS